MQKAESKPTWVRKTVTWEISQTLGLQHWLKWTKIPHKSSKETINSETYSVTCFSHRLKRMQDNLGPPWRPAIHVPHNLSLREPQSDGWNSGKPSSICQFRCQGLWEGEAIEERKDAQLHQQHFKASLVCCWVFPSNPSSPGALGPSLIWESSQSESLKSSGQNERSEKWQNGFSSEDWEQPPNQQQLQG